VERVVRPGLDGLVRVLWTIPKTPPSLNVWQSMHWGAQYRTKNAWFEYIQMYARRDAVRPPAEHDLRRGVHPLRGRHRDLSNYDSVLWKIFPDVLIRAGVIADDTETEMRRGKVSLISDRKLMGVYTDPRLAGFTRIALIAKPKE